MAVTLANSNKAYVASSTQVASQNLAFPNSVSSGNFLVVGGGTTGNPNAGTDAANWSSSPTNTFVHDKGETYERVNIAHVQSAASGATTITFTAEASDYTNVAIAEFAGVASSSPVDGSDDSQTADSVQPTVGPITTTTAGVMFSMFVMNGSATITEDSGVVIGEDEGWVGAGGAANYKIYTSGNQTVVWTCSAVSAWTAAAVCYKAAAAGSVSISPANGSLTITGQTPVRILDNPRSPANASLVIAGQAPTFIGATQVYSPGTASLVITGQAPTKPLQIYRLPSNADLTLTGQIPSAVGVQGSPTISPANASLVIAGQAPTFNIAGSLGITPANASLTIATQVPVLDYHIIVPEAALTAQLVWVAEPTAAGYDIGYGTTSGVYTTVIDVGNVTEYLLGPLPQGVYYVAARGYDELGVRGSYGTQIVFNANGLVITPQSVSMDMTITANANVAQLVISGRAPFPFIPSQYIPGTASLVLTGQAPSLQVMVTKSPAFASLVISGQAPNVSIPGVIGVNFADLLITGGTPALLFSHNTFPSFGSLVITGQAPTLVTNTGNFVIIVGTSGLTITPGTAPTLLFAVAGAVSGTFRGRIFWNPKIWTETKNYYFDASQLTVGTVLTIGVTATVYSGDDPNPAAIVSGLGTLSGGQIRVLVTGGIPGTLYELECIVTTTDGLVLSQTAVLLMES